MTAVRDIQTPQHRETTPASPVSIRGTVIFGLFVIAALIGGVGVWGATAQLSSAVIAQGFVTVDSNRKSVQHVDGGSVKSILARDGDKVSADQPLVVLDDANPQANYRILKSGLAALIATEARLFAEQDDKDTVSFPESLTSQAEDPKVAELMEGQSNLFRARKSALSGELQILTQRVSQLEEEILGLNAQVNAKTLQLSFILRELTGLKSLFDRGLAGITRVLALEREQAKLDGERGELLASTARTKKNIGETKLQMLQLDRKMREEVSRELREVQPKIIDMAERTAAAENTLKRIIIRAPVAGTVVSMTVHNTNAVITPGQTVAEIVPDGDELVIEAKIQPADADNLVIGQEAEIRIIAFNQRTTAPLKGAFSYISADRITEARTGEIYYKARVSVTPDQLPDPSAKKLIPGMPAEVIIKTGSRTALNYIVQPIMTSLNRAWREE